MAFFPWNSQASSGPALIREAAGRLEKGIRHTELILFHHFSDRIGVPVFFECENLQRTGSFRIRGALNSAAAGPCPDSESHADHQESVSQVPPRFRHLPSHSMASTGQISLHAPHSVQSSLSIT